MLTILMCYYKNDSPLFLKQALMSLLVQCDEFDEIVIVRDGPCDDPLNAVCSDFLVKFKTKGVRALCVASEKNVGLGNALALGSKQCSNDYIVRMDSDDISRPNRMSELKQLISDNPDVAVFGAAIEEFQHEPGDLNQFRLGPLTHEKIMKSMGMKNPINHVTACIKKDALYDVGGYEDVTFFEDYFLWLKMAKSQYKFMNHTNVHVDVRVEGMVSRRHGLQYFLKEVAFTSKAKRLGAFSFLTFLTYLALRIPVRFAPLSFTKILYRFMRRIG